MNDEIKVIQGAPNEVMEFHKNNSVEDHSVDKHRWVPKALRNERVWSHEEMMRVLNKEE